MLADVLAACEAVAPTVVARGGGGQAPAVLEALAGVSGPVAIVNADLPCATADEIAALLAGTPSLVEAPDGTTNALALADASHFEPLYGPGSAARFAALGLRPLDLPGLREDVDTVADLERLEAQPRPQTRAALERVRLACG